MACDQTIVMSCNLGSRVRIGEANLIQKVFVMLGAIAISGSAEAEVYCKTVGVPKGCVMAPKGAGATGVGVLPGAGAGAPGVGIAPGPGVGAPGAGVGPGQGLNRGGPVNRVGPR
jgi:hypothetical protein